MNLFFKLLKLIFTLIEYALRILFESIFGGQHTEKLEGGYNAHFISEDELISSSYKGVSISGDKFLSMDASFKNCIIFGATGSGKSTINLVPTIINSNRQIIIAHDPASELHRLCAQAKIEQGYKVYTINYGSKHSHGYNPLHYCDTISDINKVSTALVRNSVKSQGDNFWEIQSISLISLIISILKTQEKQYQNLANVRYLISNLGSNPEKIDTLFSQFASQQLMTEYKNFISYDQKVVASIIASAQAALSLLLDENVQKLTSIHQIDFERIHTEKSIVFIQNISSDIHYYKPLVSLVFEQLFRHLSLKLPEKKHLDVMFLIDEASNLVLPSLPNFVSVNRKFRVSLTLAYQNYTQVSNFYGHQNADTIFSNCLTKIFYSGGSLQDTQMLESILGKRELVDEEGKKTVLPLLTSENIRTLNNAYSIVIHANLKPMMVKCLPWYQNFWMKRKITETNPPLNPYLPEEISFLPLH
jgi:type IV secretion system protein VirD4